MKGSTHFLIGVGIGVGATLHYPFSVDHASIYLTTATFSALAADLDHQNVLNAKLTKVAHSLLSLLLALGLLVIVVASYVAMSGREVPIISWIFATLLILIGLLTRSGLLRNLLMTSIASCIAFLAWSESIEWMIGLAAFVGIVPWLPHRGLSHTLWACLLWATIGRFAEQDLQIPGLAIVASLGYLSHLIGDSVTSNGLKWFYPVSDYKFHLYYRRK